MNIGLPKTQNGIAAFRKVRIARGISLEIGDLYGTFRRGVDGRIAMPEITIPLNDDSVIRNESINDELTADNLLFLIPDGQAVENRVTGTLQTISAGAMGKSENAVYPLHIGVIVAASMGTVFRLTPSNLPTGSIKGFAASFAPQHFATPPNGNRSISSGLSGLWRGLPSISASNRAKTSRTAAPGFVLSPAPITSKGRTAIALSRSVGTWRENLAALRANRGFPMIFHNVIIPWSIAPCK